MSSTAGLAHEMVAGAVQASFRNWASGTERYKRTYLKLKPEALTLADTALSEIDKYHPGYFLTWWAREHMRFSMKISGVQFRYVHELLHDFLSLYDRGKLEKPTTTKPRKPRGRKKRKTTRSASA